MTVRRTYADGVFDPCDARRPGRQRAAGVGAGAAAAHLLTTALLTVPGILIGQGAPPARGRTTLVAAVVAGLKLVVFDLTQVPPVGAVGRSRAPSSLEVADALRWPVSLWTGVVGPGRSWRALGFAGPRTGPGPERPQTGVPGCRSYGQGVGVPLMLFARSASTVRA